MIIIENNAALLNDIVFKSRNKSYGAYVIRSEYGNTILKSLGATILFFVLVCSLAVWLTNTVEEVKKLDISSINIVTPVDLYVEPPVTPPAKKAVITPVVTPVASNANTDAFSTNLNDHAIEQNTNVTRTTDGVNNPTGQTSNPDVVPGDVGGNNPIGGGEGPEGASAKPEPMPDVMPYFDNMAAFLQKNLRYPAMALDANVSGKVIVNFIIDEEGKIEKTTILKGVGYGCDEEALRVIKLMLKWHPGIKNGKPVKATFNQAIVFRLQ